MKRIFIAVAFLIVGMSYLSHAQDNNKSLATANWATLAKVTYKVGKDEYGELSIPVFGDEIQKLAGKEIELPGYIIPFDGMFKPDHIILSSLPVAACFFCGSGGPESVIEIYLKEPIKYTANGIKVRGKLELNETDYNQLMYILKDAVMVGPAN
ncbi:MULTISPECIES: hypothetical protein [unclassified Imperialibacter]|uniref:hypothetical protein n=1 Tax=unclassified Imperialibacter TaxID=2629706 RepID=UPI00125B725E|nr:MULTISPECIES: hypothetical protein [unclassified Imperialibacter]CAD5273623.1 conserved exported hypothetical protein [Imperialibacter sp. 89]CAD5289281.1 conserved exported hypothetical protein [Imperialibacter sp. 75]VVT13993.1 conserved exported hypothetical protein [Imperialibacter sp. EC-SDR9]